MPTDYLEHMSKLLADAQSKYTYFLMAIAASAIALVIQRTTDRSLELNMIILGVAVVSWAGSFFAGCINRSYFNATVLANIAVIQIKRGQHSDVPNHPDFIEAAARGAYKGAEENSSSANFWGHLQFRLLVFGACAYIAWHIWEMANTTLPTRPSFPVV